MPFPTTARVVIIGGGIVGVSTLYHLAGMGWRDCLLLERNDLTAGSTWHAAGNCPSFSTSPAIMNMQRYSLALYRGLAEAVGYPIDYHVTGSVRLAHSRNRMMEFEHVAGLGRAQGMALEICTPEELQAHHPFMEIHDLEGGLWDPRDGDIDPAQLTQALAKGARDRGATVARFTPVTGIDRRGGEWIVHTAKGDVRCEFVVNAAGYYAPRVGAWFLPFGGRPVPAAVMAHQYMLTEEIPELRQWSRETGRKLPILRDVDTSYYLRQDKAGLNLGPYERHGRLHWGSDDDPMPEDFSFQLFPDDLDRLTFQIEDAMARLPILAAAGLAHTINGPIPYAPDGNPLIGPMPGVPNAFEAHSFTFGIVQGGGAGKVAAEWIVEGAPEWDMWACDPRRFTDFTDPAYCRAKAREVYGHEYAMHFPRHAWPAGRDRKRSPLHDRLQAAGGQFAAENGWERATWFAQPGDERSEASTQSWARSGPWEPRVAAECAAVRDGCGIAALTGLTRLEIAGPGARAFADGLCATRLRDPGRISLACFPDARGRLLTEATVTVHADDEVVLVGAPAAQWHDREALEASLPASLTLTDFTGRRECLLVTGPTARAILAPLTAGHDLSAPWFSVSTGGQVAGRACTLVRISRAGELGWEIHCANDDAPAIWEAVTAAGAVPVGMFALDSLRLEKGYRRWGAEVSPAVTPLEAGYGRALDLDTPRAFPGKAALLAERARGGARRLVTLIVAAGTCDAPAGANILRGDEIVGTVTSGGWGYRIGASIALGVVRADLTHPGTELAVGIYGENRPATVQSDGPLWDPENLRLRA